MDVDASDMMIASEKINSVLLNNHIYVLNDDINDMSVENVIKWILYENTIDEPNKELTLYINSIGGSLMDAFALIDVMRTSTYPIKTVGIGSVISAAFLIFASGTKGMRVISKNASIMCHQYSGGIFGKHHDIQAQYKETQLMEDRMVKLLGEVTGLDAKTVKKSLLPPTDVWLTPEDLIEYGIADIIA